MKNITYEDDPYKAAVGADAIAVLTDWKEYKDLDYKKIFKGMRKPAFIFDGRNFLDHNHLFNIGYEVYSIGKGRLSHLQ